MKWVNTDWKPQNMQAAILHYILLTKKMMKTLWCIYFNFEDNLKLFLEFLLRKTKAAQLTTKGTQKNHT